MPITHPTRRAICARPQVLGLLAVIAGLGLRLQEARSTGPVALVVLFQLVISPIASHMVGRAAF